MWGWPKPADLLRHLATGESEVDMEVSAVGLLPEPEMFAAGGDEIITISAGILHFSAHPLAYNMEQAHALPLKCFLPEKLQKPGRCVQHS